MTSQQMIDRTRANYEAFARGDAAHVLDDMSDDIVWRISGNTPISGERRGKQAVGEFLGQLMQLTGGTYKIEVHDILASDDHVVTLAKQYADRGGKHLEDNVVHVVHYDAEGRVKEFWAIPEDQAEVDRFFS